MPNMNSSCSAEPSAGWPEDGVTILLTTQYLEEADQPAETIAMLDRGRIVARGTADQLKSNLGTEVVRLQFADASSYQRAASPLGAARTDDRLRTIDVATDGSAAGVHVLLGRLEGAGTLPLKLSTHRPSLDDVFRSLTGAEAVRCGSKEMAR